MDNPLTPNKIQRLMHLAEDKSFHLPKRLQMNNDDLKSITSSHLGCNKTGTNYESSSGIIDLEKVEGFDESGIGNISLSKSTAFNPGEMTGRSTGTEEGNRECQKNRGFEEYGRHSMALDSITSHMDKQTLEINDIMRHSIATNYSFHSKRDLTADEASLVMREAPLPIQHSTQANFQESMQLNSLSNMSVGSYFKNRCVEFGTIFKHSDSPDRPSITEVSSTVLSDVTPNNPNKTYKLDQNLDSIPVKQPKATTYERPVVTNLFPNDTSGLATKLQKVDVTALQENSINRVPGKINHPNPKYTATKPTDILIRNLQSSFRPISEDTEYSSMENSLSISKIADYLGKQSNISVTDILQLNKEKKQPNRKQPLTELHMNILENQKPHEVVVTHLKDTKNMETASSSGTVDTVISLDKLKIAEEKVPIVVVTGEMDKTRDEDLKTLGVPSSSPSSKSRSTLSTIQEVNSSKSGDSPSHYSKVSGAISQHVPSPNLEYRELDKSVDWQEVLQQKRYQQNCLAKEQWAEITVSSVEGFVGVTTTIEISVTTLSNTWLTAKVEFDNTPNKKDLTIELPRLPLLLSPGETEKLIIHITSNVEMETYLPFTIFLKDTSIDDEIEQKGRVEISIKTPTIQALSCDGVNKVNFPPIQEESTVTKYFVLISDCPIDLRLELSIAEGESMFIIKSVQEIKKNDVSKALMERQVLPEDNQMKVKGKIVNKHFCRLSSGNAIKVTILFNAPKLIDLELTEKVASFKGTLNVNLIGLDTILKKVSLFGTVGCTNLVLQSSASKLHVTNETMTITLHNTGTIGGVWAVKFKRNAGADGHCPFKVSATKLEIRPGSAVELSLVYTGPQDVVTEGNLILEDTATGNITTIDIVGGTDKPKSFPIKTNHNNMSWVRSGRKELSLKNSTNRKIHMRCQIVGEGFTIDVPGIETKGTFVLSFSPYECRPLPIVFAPNSSTPRMAALHLVIDKSSEFSRKVKLHGSDGGEGLRWSGLVTYDGHTALVRALARAPIQLTLFNKSQAPVFVCAQVHFNLQYRFVAAESKVSGSRRVVNRRTEHTVSLHVPWDKLERRARLLDATALATVTVLTGPEFTRRRILRIIRNESNKDLDMSLLPDHLKVLAETFEGEDLAMDAYLDNFSETKGSLNELFEGLQELTAQINLPQGFSEENTIMITDDTVVEHHTLCD